MDNAEAIVDIRLRPPGLLPPPGESFWTYTALRRLRHRATLEKIWRHPENRKYITCRYAARGKLSHRQPKRDILWSFGAYGFRVTRVDRQTDRQTNKQTNRPTHHNNPK